MEELQCIFTRSRATQQVTPTNYLYLFIKFALDVRFFGCCLDFHPLSHHFIHTHIRLELCAGKHLLTLNLMSITETQVRPVAWQDLPRMDGEERKKMLAGTEFKPNVSMDEMM